MNPGLELLFNVEKDNIRSREDCIVVAIHSFLLKEDFYCVGIGDEWPESKSGTCTEMLPNEWNRNQNIYSLRYKKRGCRANVLIKITKVNNLLLVDAVLNEDLVANMSVPFEKYVSDNYNEYVTTYRKLESLSGSFKNEVIKNIQFAIQGLPRSPKTQNKRHVSNPTVPSPLPRPQANFERDDERHRYTFPEIGGQDLDPLGVSRGGMLMDPFGTVPRRPGLQDFGVGGPGGLPRGAVPPGSRFDPIRPPVRPSRPSPDPDHLKPPDDNNAS